MPLAQAGPGAWVRAYEAEILVALAGSILILLVLWIDLYRRAAQAQARVESLAAASEGVRLEEMVSGYLSRAQELAPRVEAMEVVLDALQEAQRRSLQYIGVVRFDAFEEVGGHQSSAVALLDGYLDGMVISTIYSRSDARVYTKVVKDGKSESPLTEEEREAINIARAAVQEQVMTDRRARGRR
ncbi:MAG: DUF4446 family protein [Armatimonadetes bacterium]|nr:DUF4446 family protein [Armatimonadota bacterium]